jgi:uncharacterized membrane protein
MHELHWAHGGAATLAAFLSSLVEFVEALTIVIAAGATRGWRSSLFGTVAAAAVLAVLTLALGPAVQRIDLAGVQLGIGVLLLLFGMRWARKAILRSAGVIEPHDEAEAFGREQEILRSRAPQGRALDRAGFTAAFQGVFLEGLEVVFIVVAIGGADHNFTAAALGAAAAAAVVIAAALIVHRPLTRVPENTLKYVVAVMLSAFGTFWVGEGLGIQWPDRDWALLSLIVAYFIVFSAAVRVAVRQVRGRPTHAARTGDSA